MEIVDLVKAYSPWLVPEKLEDWRRLIPAFKRPVYYKLRDDLCAIDQIISITGPRRVGKSTLLHQLIDHLMNEKNIAPDHVIYYSFDDPALFRPGRSGAELIESLMEQAHRAGSMTYLFLDEIQTLDRWEQYLKKYYDLKYPVRIVVSGSASSPIFKKSRESLLGRIKDYHVLPFSFREYLLYRLKESRQADLISEVERLNRIGQDVKGMWVRNPEHIDLGSVSVERMSDELWNEAAPVLDDFLVDGGFPEVWKLPTPEKKIEYLFDNQVKKVIYEDLVLATEFRKPELLKAFYVSLLERPGQEVNTSSLSSSIGVGVQQIEKYLPLLEMTDLLNHASKFRSSAIRLRKGHRKYYLVDLALRNAVLRLGREILTDPEMLGLYAENLVFNILKRWDGVLQVDYYRDGAYEVDFVVHTSPSKYWPVEVKYQNRIAASDFKGLKHFNNRYPCHVPAVVTKHREDWGRAAGDTDVFRFPLPLFLLMFD